MNLKTLIPYTEKSIVSHQLARTEKVEITLFACDKGEKIHPHQIPTSAWLRVEEGLLDVLIGENTHSLTEGDFIELPPNIPHALSALDKTRFLLIREL
ncbi:MAG: cupin domain-containing protein [Brevinematales bacterium]